MRTSRTYVVGIMMILCLSVMAQAEIASSETSSAVASPRVEEATSPRFIDHGNGTITDARTGLMWVKDPAAAGVGEAYSWDSAIKESQNLSWGAHSDWRLPDANELQSLVDYTRTSPCIDPIFECQGSFYWTSSINVSSTDAAWNVDFFHGYVDWGYKPNVFYIRPVRNCRD